MSKNLFNMSFKLNDMLCCHSSLCTSLNDHMNQRVNEIIPGGVVGVDGAFYPEILHLPARRAALCHPDWGGVWGPHKFYVAVGVRLGWQCVGTTVQESAPHRLWKAGIWFAGRLNLALPRFNLGHWVTGTHCGWHTGAHITCTCGVLIYICMYRVNMRVFTV